MEPSKYTVIFKRFLRGFVAGGIAASVPLLTGLLEVNDLTTLKKFGLVVSVAFLGGGLQAIDKLMRWVDPEQPEPLSNEPTGQD